MHLNANFLLKNYTEDTIKDYNGTVIHYDFRYQQTADASYKNVEKREFVRVQKDISSSQELLELLKPVTVPPLKPQIFLT